MLKRAISFLDRHLTRRGAILVLVSLAAQLIALGLFAHYASANKLDMFQLIGDENSYRVTALNMLNARVFSYSKGAPYYPDTVRTPGYPLLLSVFYAVTRNWMAVTVLQTVLLAFTPFVLYLILKKINERYAFAAAMVFALEPLRVLFSNVLMSDVYFTLVFLIGLLFFMQWLEKDERKWHLVASGLVLGYSTMVRPSALFLWAPLSLVIMWKYGRRGFKTALWKVAVFAASFFVIISPWILRNYFIFGVPSISVIGTYSLAHVNALWFDAEKRGITIPEMNERFNAMLPTLESDRSPSLTMEPILKKYFFDVVSSDPVGYAKYQIIKTIPFMITDGLRAPATLMGIVPPSDSVPNISNIFMHRQFGELAAYFKSQPLIATLHLFGTAFWLCAWILASVGLFFMVKQKPTRTLGILMILLFMYFVAIYHGPAGQGRYRFPLDGFLIFFSILALDRIIQPWRKSRTGHQSHQEQPNGGSV